MRGFLPFPKHMTKCVSRNQDSVVDRLATGQTSYIFLQCSFLALVASCVCVLIFIHVLDVDGKYDICLMCDLLTSVLVTEHQSESSGNTAWPAVLVHVGSYFCTTWLVVRLWFFNLCTGFQGTPGVTVWSCLCLYMLVTAATQPSQLCGCSLLASVQDFMPPAWNMQVSERCFFWYSVFIVLYLFVIHVLYFFGLSFPKIFSYTASSPCEPCVMTRCFNTPHNVCVYGCRHVSLQMFLVHIILIHICCLVFLVDTCTLKRRWAPEYKWLHPVLVQCSCTCVHRIWEWLNKLL